MLFDISKVFSSIF